MIKTLKKINRFLGKIINFILSAVIYFTGGLFSWILYQFSKKRRNGRSYWINYEKKDDDYRRQF